AFEESGKLSVITVEMFANVLKSVFTRFTVPEGVAGPVGIAQLTHTFVQEGILSLLRFMALLSLSLAIINILPFPALDGGRLFFILVEVVTGRKLGGKFEAWIHAIGFVLLMLLIFAVTYNDILRLL
ncbi:MAG TPA: site-2 protease family protein, partial [Candidatus Gracilibacteria bacterium]|nr:site-2 protease family protein [Candidatus Gracilibacteria bacterium]